MTLKERFFFNCIKADKIEKARQFLKIDKNLVNASDVNGNTGLHLIQSLEMMDLLLENGADVNARNKAGDTPIFVAMTPKIALGLHEKGALLNTKNFNSDTLLIKYARRINNDFPILTPAEFLEVWPMFKTSDINSCAKNKDGKIARDYLKLNDPDQKKIAIRLSHHEMAVRCSKKSSGKNVSEGK